MRKVQRKAGRRRRKRRGSTQIIREMIREIRTSNNKIQPALFIFIFIFINKQNKGDFFNFIPADKRKGGQLPRGQELGVTGAIKVQHTITQLLNEENVFVFLCGGNGIPVPMHVFLQFILRLAGF